MLYIIALLDAIMIISKYAFNVEVKNVSQEISETGSVLGPFMVLLENNKSIVSELNNYLTPRPVGIFAILMALFLAHVVKISNKN